jgi:hypothetical protein
MKTRLLADMVVAMVVLVLVLVVVLVALVAGTYLGKAFTVCRRQEWHW